MLLECFFATKTLMREIQHNNTTRVCGVWCVVCGVSSQELNAIKARVAAGVWCVVKNRKSRRQVCLRLRAPRSATPTSRQLPSSSWAAPLSLRLAPLLRALPCSLAARRHQSPLSPQPPTPFSLTPSLYFAVVVIIKILFVPCFSSNQPACLRFSRSWSTGSRPHLSIHSFLYFICWYGT